MGLIHIGLFATLDLVGQSPDGPDEDPAGFAFGGWQAPLLDEVVGGQALAAFKGTDALLLGRRTYEAFAAFWPHQQGGEFGELFNGIPKYVASRGRPMSRGPGPRSSARTCPARCAWSATGTGT